MFIAIIQGTIYVWVENDESFKSSKIQVSNPFLINEITTTDSLIPSKQETFPQIANITYLDNATSNPLPQISVEKMRQAMEELIPTVDLSIHSLSRKSAEVMDEAGETIGRWLDIEPSSLQWLPNRDFATNLAVKAFPKANSIFISLFDDLAVHGAAMASNKNPILLDERHSTWEEELPEKAERGDILVLNHISPVLGRVRKIETITRIAKDLEMISIVDFSYTAAQFDISRLINLPSISIIDGTRDLLGPPGSTILIDNFHSTSPFLGTRNIISYSGMNEFQINRKSFEMGIPNVFSIIGQMHSIKLLKSIGRPQIFDRKTFLGNIIQDVIGKRGDLLKPAITLGEANFTNEPSSIHTFAFNSASAHDFALIGDETFSLKVRSGLLCSHIAMDRLGWNDAVQVSTHMYNDQEDVNILERTLDEFEAFL